MIHDVLTPQWILTAMALGVGVSFALVAWVLSRLAAAVPAQDRLYLDPPPLGFRVLWWPIQWLAYYLVQAIPPDSHARLLDRLRLAGVDFALDPAQYLAGRMLWGLLWGLAGVWLAGNFQIHWLAPALGGIALGYSYPALWLKDRIAARRNEALKSLPFMLDLITLCVESGLNLNGAITQAVQKGPPGVLRDEFTRLLRDLRAGKPRSDALRDLSRRMNMPAVTSFIGSVIQADITGMSLGPILRAQAEQRRIERFARAEKLAMEAPVKMLFPLIAFIFPCVFVILLFPIVMKFLAVGN